MSQDDTLDDELEMAPGQVAQVAAAITPPPPPEPDPEIDVLDLDQVLAFTQKKRMRVIGAINKKLHEIEDPAMFSALFKGLGDMDKAVVQRKRVGIEEEAAKTADEAARDHAALLRSITARAMQVPVGEAPPRDVPKLNGKLGAVELVPGETDQGPHEMSYDAFAQGIEGKP